MKRGFKLALTDEVWTALGGRPDPETGRAQYVAHQGLVHPKLDGLLSPDDGVVKASDLAEVWFPTVKARVFLSHSHRDEADALALAAALKTHFGLEAFVDSAVWGYADQLLLRIAKEHCAISDGLYRFQDTIWSASNVHLMLAHALTQMLCRCECVIFLDTPNALKPSQVVGATDTLSPWIHHELAMSRVLWEQRRRPLLEKVAKSIQFQYTAETDHLVSLSNVDLWSWRLGASLADTDPLKVLYARHPVPDGPVGV